MELHYEDFETDEPDPAEVRELFPDIEPEGLPPTLEDGPNYEEQEGDYGDIR